MVKAAYQKAIRNHPPESSPLEFKKINAAYEALKDEDDRLHYEIGIKAKKGEEFSSLKEATTEYLRADINPTPPSKKEFLKFLKA